MGRVLAAGSDVSVAWIGAAAAVLAALLGFLGVWMSQRSKQQDVKVDDAVGKLIARLVKVEGRADRYEERADLFERRAEECEERERNHLRDHHGHG